MSDRWRITTPYQDILHNGVANPSDCIGYIGRSIYTLNDGFSGSVKSFKMYNYTLTSSEISEQFVRPEGDAAVVARAKKDLIIPNINDIRGNVTLPVKDRRRDDCMVQSERFSGRRNQPGGACNRKL